MNKPKDNRPGNPVQNVQRPAAPQKASPSSQPPAAQLTFSLSIDNKLKSKLPLAAVILVLFTFSMVLFARANLSFSDMFEFSRLAVNFEKLYSISLMLFIVLFSV